MHFDVLWNVDLLMEPFTLDTSSTIMYCLGELREKIPCITDDNAYILLGPFVGEVVLWVVGVTAPAGPPPAKYT
jgi:hypothetical protein